MRKLAPVHPGEILFEEFMKPLGISQYRLAKDIKVPPRRINEIVLRKRRVTADTALRLGRFFGTSEQFWLHLQSEFDLDTEKDRLGNRLHREVTQFKPPPVATAARVAASGYSRSSKVSGRRASARKRSV